MYSEQGQRALRTHRRHTAIAVGILLLFHVLLATGLIHIMAR